MNRTNSQKGQALILIAFGIVALIGFTALAVDGGRVFSDRRNAQNAADTSALAAALAEIREDPAGYQTRGLERAASNGYSNDTDSTVTIVFCNTVTGSDPCLGLPPGANPAEYIRVKITSDVPMTFARVLGREFVTNRVEAITRVQGTVANGVFNAGAGLYSVRDDPVDDCFKVNGSADLVLHNTGIFVNCSGSSALFLNGSADIGMDANARVAGCTNNPNFPITGTGVIDCGVAQQVVSKSTFEDVPTTKSPNPCTGQGSKLGNIMSPGNFPGSVSITDGTIFNPGTYCFQAGLTLGNPSVNFSGTGQVQWVLSSSPSLAGTADFDDLEIYATNQNFTIKNSGTLISDRFRFFGVGNSSFTVQGGTFTSSDTYIYSESGMIDINAQANVNMHAPPQGDPFGGLLLYMPWDNPNDFELNGGVNNTWYGTVLMPHTNVTYNGGAGFKLYGQVIGYTFKINGGGQSDIFFDSTVIYSPPNEPTIEFTK